MGYSADAKCLDCGKSFEVSHGGGFFFHLLRCNKCGKTKSISFDKIPELHGRFLKGLKAPYSVLSAEHDKQIREQCKEDPITEQEYYKEIEKIAGRCRCSGEYTFDAVPRCPKCRSQNIEEGEVTECYD